MPYTRQDLLREAAERDRQEQEESQRIEDGSGSDSLCTYRRVQAQHLRFLAVNAPDENE